MPQLNFLSARKSLLATFCLSAVINMLTAKELPNILWIVAEDTSPWMGCYGSEVNQNETTAIDRMAREGVIFKRAFAATPVCSSSRSALSVGVNPIRFNAHEHRSRGAALPADWKTIPHWMQEAGYQTFNMGKLDYNYHHSLLELYPANAVIVKGNKHNVKNAGELRPWRKMPLDKPFFGQIQLTGGKRKPSLVPVDRLVSPDNLEVPGDYPNNQTYREIMALHYNNIREDDMIIGGILEALEEDGLLDSTIVVYISDHGCPEL